mmetsp:Transcript_1483/g.4569  ORF Transcript_1483/g.4569 Transcript_1483/m.4569 type:complete len:379 (+) Transcript_1483:1484-2620(+)
MPWFTMACVRTAAVVVPSPAFVSDLAEACVSSFAPRFISPSGSEIARAIVTPSLTICGAWYDSRCSTTFRPFGPSVTFTALATALMPAASFCCPASLKVILFAASRAAAEGERPSWVSDVGRLLAEEDRAAVDALCEQAHDAWRVEVAVVVLDSLPADIRPSAFAAALLNYWGVGDARLRSGLLLLLLLGRFLQQVLERVVEHHVGLRPRVLPLHHHLLRLRAGLQVHPLVVLFHALAIHDLRTDALELHRPVLGVDAVLLRAGGLLVYAPRGDDARAEAHVRDVGAAALEHHQGGRHGVGVRHEDHVLAGLCRLADVRLYADDVSVLGVLQRLGPSRALAEDLDAAVDLPGCVLGFLQRWVHEPHAQTPGHGLQLLG